MEKDKFIDMLSKIVTQVNTLTARINGMMETMDAVIGDLRDVSVLLETQDKRIKQISDREMMVETIITEEGKGRIILES